MKPWEFGHTDLGSKISNCFVSPELHASTLVTGQTLLSSSFGLNRQRCFLGGSDTGLFLISCIPIAVILKGQESHQE